MNSGYQSNQTYNKMLTQFVKGLFKDLIIRKTERLGMTVNIVNASYSSIGGYVKYGLINKLPTDIAASLWLARQSLYGKEYKKEVNISYKKKHHEKVSLPYEFQPKQSNKLNEIVQQWKEISSILGTNRKLWYKNLINSTKPNDINKRLLQEDSMMNPFEDLVI